MSTSATASRKLPNTRESAMAAMRNMISDFRKQSITWEHELEKLIDDTELLALNATLDANTSRQQAELRANQHFDELTTYQNELARQQQSTVSELAVLRQIVEQQTELLSAFVDAAERNTMPAKAAPAARERNSVLAAAQAEFENLQKQSSGKSKR